MAIFLNLLKIYYNLSSKCIMPMYEIIKINKYINQI